MLRLFQNFGARLSRSAELTRRFSSEALMENDDLERKKEMKIFELEIDVSFVEIIRS